MSKFNFSTPASGGLFGQTQQGAQPTFGAMATPTSAAGVGFGGLGGTPASTQATGFGGFGALTSTPANSAAPQLNFGSPANTLAATPQFGGFGMGATTQGAPTNTLTGTPQFTGFGATPTSTAATPQFTGLGGAPTSTAATPQFGFGQPQTSTAAPLFSGFGAPTTTSAAPTFSGFGAPASTAAAPTFTGFGATSTAATTGFGLGGTTNAATPSLFGTKTTTATQPLTSFSTAGGSLFGTTSTALGGQTATLTTAPAANVGLGGVDLNATQPKAVESGNAQKDGAKVKETQLPKEIIATVEDLKTHIKQQKTLSSEIARTSTSKLFDVSSKIDGLNWSLSEMANFVETNYTALKQLRSETSRAIQHAEMAQRTHETPAGLQFENQAPLKYFDNLVQQYEHDLIQFRKQVELTEKHMHSIANPQSLTPDDLKRGLHQIHESFVALAGRLHDTHQKVESQKEQYLNLRKYLLRDKTNVFEQLEHDSGDINSSNQPKITSGPTPFSSVLTGMSRGVSMHTAVGQQQPSGGIGEQSFGMSKTFGGGSLFGGSAFGAPANFSTGTDTFNLQKPPIGAKRNKP